MKKTITGHRSKVTGHGDTTLIINQHNNLLTRTLRARNLSISNVLITGSKHLVCTPQVYALTQNTIPSIPTLSLKLKCRWNRIIARAQHYKTHSLQVLVSLDAVVIGGTLLHRRIECVKMAGVWGFASNFTGDLQCFPDLLAA